MFVHILEFPPIMQGKDAEFRDWFASTNAQFAGYPGLVSRKLLVEQDSSNYVAVVEHESIEAFKRMQASDEHAAAGARLKPLLDGKPSRRAFDVVVG